MTYQAIDKETSELVTLSHIDVNDIDCDSNGRVVIYGVNGKSYFALLTTDDLE